MLPDSKLNCYSDAASLRMDPGGCSLPFQYANGEYYGCVETNSTPQCAAANKQLTDCITPAGECCDIAMYFEKTSNVHFLLNLIVGSPLNLKEALEQ